MKSNSTKSSINNSSRFIAMFMALIMLFVGFSFTNALQVNAASGAYDVTVDIFGGDDTTALQLANGETIDYTVDDSNANFRRFTFTSESPKESIRVINGGIDKIGAFGTEKTFVVTPEFAHAYLLKDIPVNYYMSGDKQTGDVKGLLVKVQQSGMNFYYSTLTSNVEVPYNNATRDVELTDEFTPEGADKSGQYQSLLTIDDEIWGEMTFAVRNEMGEDYDKQGESNSWTTAFMKNGKLSGGDAVAAEKLAHFTMPAPPPEVDLGNGKYTYIVDLFNYDLDNLPALYDASNPTQAITIRAKKDRVHGFYRLTLKSDNPELSLILKNGNNDSEAGAFGNGTFVVTSEYPHVYLVDGLVPDGYSSSKNPSNPKVTYYMNSIEGGKIELLAIKEEGTQPLTLYYNNPSTKTSITVDEKDNTSNTESLSNHQELIPEGQNGDNKSVFTIESPSAVAPSSDVWFKVNTTINTTDKTTTTLFGTGEEDSIDVSSKNALFNMPAYGTILIDEDTQWKYSDTNTDPFNEDNSNLYKALVRTGNVDSVDKVYSAWTYPTSPYQNYELNALTDGPTDIGYSDSDWKLGVGPFAYKKSSYPVAWGTVRTTLEGLIADSDKQISSYFFRYDFDLQDTDSIQSAYYKLRYDDAAIIYINGVEVARHNVKDGGYDSNLAYGSQKGLGDFEEQSAFIDIPSGLLREGSNTIAVEVHQASDTSSDVYLNFMNFTLLQEQYVAEPALITNVNIAPGVTETERNFAWATNSNNEGTLTYWIGEEAPVTVKATSSKMTKKEGYNFNQVTLTDLKPGVTYNYVLANGDPKDGGAATQVNTFSTDKNANSYSFVVATDSQLGKNGLVEPVANAWNNTLEKVENAWPDISFMVSSGDQIEHPDNEYQYSLYFSSPFMAKYPVTTTVGSHDKNAIYLEHFNLPELTSVGESVTGGDYSFTYGKTLFISLDTNARSQEDIEIHKQFMKDAIKDYKDSHNGEEPEWKVVNYHYSMYSSSIHASDDDIRLLRAELSPTMAELDIDVAFSGHDHCYTRTLMMGGEGNANGGTIEAGTAGSRPITTGYVAVGDNKYAEYTKNKGEAFYLTGNAASLGFNPLQSTDFEYSAKSEQASRPSVTLVEVTPDSMTFKSYYTDVDITEESLFDSFVLRH